MNNWRISPALEKKIRERDKLCVYCLAKMKPGGLRSLQATWEHINNNDVSPENEDNIVMCCGSCNSSKRDKELAEWLKTEYCRKKKISERTVAAVVKYWLRKQQKSLK